MDKKNTALIIVDMQNAFCSPKGSFWRRGGRVLNINLVIRKVKRLVSLARRKKRLIIFTRIVYRKDYSDAGLLVKRSPEIIKKKAYQAGSWDSELIEGLSTQKSDVVLKKKRYDPFIGTRLESVLKKKKIHNVVIAGLLTNVCVESLVRSAFDRGFEPIVVKDASSTYDKLACDNSLKTIKRHFAAVIPASKADRYL